MAIRPVRRPLSPARHRSTRRHTGRVHLTIASSARRTRFVPRRPTLRRRDSPSRNQPPSPTTRPQHLRRSRDAGPVSARRGVPILPPHGQHAPMHAPMVHAARGPSAAQTPVAGAIAATRAPTRVIRVPAAAGGVAAATAARTRVIAPGRIRAPRLTRHPASARVPKRCIRVRRPRRPSRRRILPHLRPLRILRPPRPRRARPTIRARPKPVRATSRAELSRDDSATAAGSICASAATITHLLPAERSGKPAAPRSPARLTGRPRTLTPRLLLGACAY